MDGQCELCGQKVICERCLGVSMRPVMERVMLKERDWVWKYAPVHMQDKGGYDEGYYYNYCYKCREKTEHEDEVCCTCDTHNPDPE